MAKLSNKACLFLDKIGQILYNILVEILNGDQYFDERIEGKT